MRFRDTINFFIFTSLLFNHVSLVAKVTSYGKRRKKTEKIHPDNPNSADANIEIKPASLEASAIEHNPMQTIVCKPPRPLAPPTATEDVTDRIEINLENTDLQNFLKWVEDVFEVSFLSENIIKPLPQFSNKITFKTHKALTKKQVWDLFITLLDLFGLGIVEGSVPNLYKLQTTVATAPNTINKTPLDSYINVNWSELPDNDTRIRYIYFVRNSTFKTVYDIVGAFKSTTAAIQPMNELNAFILTDKAMNIRSIMQVVEEIDQASSPEALSVLKLQNADAEDVVKLYTSLTKEEDPRGLARFLGGKKPPTSVYFPETVRLFAERRTNTLVILGDAAGIKKVEDFIIEHVDVELKVPYSPLYVYELQYASAENVVEILSKVTKFSPGSPAAQSGGVREGDKYLQAMKFEAEPAGNRILIKAEKEDYLKVRDIIKQLDVKQPQIAIEVLIVNVIAIDNRELGVQIRSKDSGTVSRNLDFQNSGLPVAIGRAAPVINETTGSLLGNLITLAESQTPGATLLSITNAATGVWGLFKILQTRTNSNVVSNPFLITTNKYTAEVSVGETRRVQTAEIAGTRDTQAFDDLSANTNVKITPQINSIGIINLDVTISIDNFTFADPVSATRNTKTIKTNSNVGNRQVLAIGGLIRNENREDSSKAPLFGDVPVLGWFFKNKTKERRKDNLLVFISPRIVEPRLQGGMGHYTKDKAGEAKQSIGYGHTPPESRDPIHRWFFKDYPNEDEQYVDDFIAKQNPDICFEIPKSLYCTESCVGEETFTLNETTTGEVSAPVVAQMNEPVKIVENTPVPKKTPRSIADFLPHKETAGIA